MAHAVLREMRFLGCCVAVLLAAGWNMSFAPLPDALTPPMTAPLRAADASADTDADMDAESDIALRLTLDGPDAVKLHRAMKQLRRRLHGVSVGQWEPLIAEASARFGIPQTWIRAVMRRESNGHTHSNNGNPIRSRNGAMGLMQLMPGTYSDLRKQYDLGHDPYDPHDNIIAATAYLKFLKERYGYPGLFAAYNNGPGNFEKHLQTGKTLPRETRDYVATVTADLQGAAPAPAATTDTTPAAAAE